MGTQTRGVSRLAALVIVVALVVAAAIFASSSLGNKSATATTTTTTTSTTNTSASSTVAPTSFNGTFVSRFCSNSTDIPVITLKTTGLQSSGIFSFGFSEVTAEWTDQGTLATSIQAVCVDAVGMVPASDSSMIIKGSTATGLQLGVSPNELVQPGQQVNTSASFIGGAGIYYQPQSGASITVISANGLSATAALNGATSATTGTLAASSVASIRSVSLVGGASPSIQFSLLQNSSKYPIGNVDVYINSTYVGTIPFGQPSGSGVLLNASVGIDEPGRIQVVSGDRYTITLASASGDEFGAQLSSTVVAG